MAQKYYSLMTNKGIEFINSKVLPNTSTIFADGWYIKLGNGQIDPTADFTDLTSVILDKSSKDYPKITFGQNVEGNYAEIIIPPSLTGEIIREAGLFNEKDELIAIAKTHIDLSQNGNGLELAVKQRIYISAVPSTINIVYTAIADLITEEFLNETIENWKKFYLSLLEQAVIPDITNGEIYYTVIEDTKYEGDSISAEKLKEEIIGEIETKMKNLLSGTTVTNIG